MLAVLAIVQAAMGQPAVAAALGTLAITCIAASIWARRLPLLAAKGTLLELIDVAIQRARRSKRFAWANYLVTAATAAYVLTLYFSDVGDAHAAYHEGERVIVVMVVLVLYALGVGLFHRYARRRARRFMEMRAQFSARNGEEPASPL
jgi:hypothetical protein